MKCKYKPNILYCNLCYSLQSGECIKRDNVIYINGTQMLNQSWEKPGICYRIIQDWNYK